MEKKYYVEAYRFACPETYIWEIGKAYFAVYEKGDIGQARQAGLLEYKCGRCGKKHLSKPLVVNGSVNETSEREARKAGLLWESPTVS
ncbi:MAG TPA: hypothetical protein VLL05_01620 [Terriglobales bacterium]|nr:hypothetical protein [Terriglobales bacterium]